jgi:hypothetical protein
VLVAILTSVASPSLLYFATLSHIRHYIRKNVTTTKCVFDFIYTHLSEKFLISKELREILLKKIYIGPHVKYPLFLSDFKELYFFPTGF